MSCLRCVIIFLGAIIMMWVVASMPPPCFVFSTVVICIVQCASGGRSSGVFLMSGFGRGISCRFWFVAVMMMALHAILCAFDIISCKSCVATLEFHSMMTHSGLVSCISCVLSHLLSLVRKVLRLEMLRCS